MKTQKAVRESFFEMFPDFASERKPGKCHNDYSTDCRCTFVDYVDGLQKDGTITRAMADKVTLGSSRPKRNGPRKVSTMLKTKELIQRYISDAITLDGYPESSLHPFLQVRDIFREEYCYPENVRRYGNGQRLFIEYLLGLPSCMGGLAYLYHEQRDLLQLWGIPAPSHDWDMSQKFYALIYREFTDIVAQLENA